VQSSVLKDAAMKWILRIFGTIVALIILLIAAVYFIGSRLPEKHSAVRVARYRQSPDAIWAVITDYEKFPSWRSNVKSVETLPSPDSAASWRELDVHGNSLPYRVVTSDPPRRLSVAIADPKLPFGGTWTTDILPIPPNGCIVQITEDGEIHNVFFRFMSRYIFGYTATMDTYLKDLGKKFGETTTIER
jgi:uncharacterized protein YndB with AHSA1/START domain